MPFSAYSVSRTTLSNVEGEWAVRIFFCINVCSTMCCQENGNNIMLLVVVPQLNVVLI
jgi:hypothetical protein